MIWGGVRGWVELACYSFMFIQEAMYLAVALLPLIMLAVDPVILRGVSINCLEK